MNAGGFRLLRPTLASTPVVRRRRRRDVQNRSVHRVKTSTIATDVLPEWLDFADAVEVGVPGTGTCCEAMTVRDIVVHPRRCRATDVRVSRQLVGRQK